MNDLTIHQSEVSRGIIDSRDAHGISISQESPMPITINEAYDASQRQATAEEAALSAKLWEIHRICLRYNNPGVNIGAHALANTILRVIEGK